MTDRVTSGSPGLDRVLCGGLPADAINLVMGLPGTGKTLLAQQCVFRNANPDHPAVYLSTASEPLEKILRYVERLSFFDPALVGHGVVYDELGTALTRDGLDATRQQISELIRRHQPALLVIDSFKALGAYARTATEFRNLLHDLAATLSAFPATTLWLGEYSEPDMATAPEFAVADSVVELASYRDQRRTARALQVFKLRGGGFLSGRHAYRLDADGLTVYPRLADPGDTSSYHRAPARVSSGVQALDDMLAEGYRTGSSTLIAGPTGIGKTLTGLHFLYRGAHQGERGVLATCQEDPIQLEQMVQSFGWSLTTDEITLMYRSPIDLYVDQWVYELLDAVESNGASRVFIDSLTDLETAADDRRRFDEFLYSLLHRFSRRNVSTMMSYGVSELFGLRRLSDAAVSTIADNVVLLQYDANPADVGRTLTVLKTRASAHATGVRPFEITRNGILLTDTPASPRAVPEPTPPT
jgi:circadian clock protein KaiC